MLNDIINLLEIHLRECVKLQKLGLNEAADRERTIVVVALDAMTAVTEGIFRLESNELKYEIVLKAKDGFRIVLSRIYKK